MRTLRVVIRTDASLESGSEHAMRCLAIAEVLCAAGHRVILASAAMPPLLLRQYQGIGAGCVSLPSTNGVADDAGATTRVVRETSADWLIADGTRCNGEWQREMRSTGVLLLTLDDDGTRTDWDANVILNPNFGCTIDEYAGVSAGTVVLTGPRYALVRQSFSSWRSWERPVPIIAQNVLVVLGDNDPPALATRCLAALQGATDISARMVVGANNPWRELLDAVIASDPESASRLSLLHSVDDVPMLMAWADVAIGTGGVALWEIAAMRLPALVVHADDRPSPSLNAYAHAGAAWSLGSARALEAAPLTRMITALCDDHATRERMVSAAGTLVDGGGAERVRGVMESWR